MCVCVFVIHFNEYFKDEILSLSQTSNSLPKTSYFKLVDVWLFFSIVMIFNVVMLQTLVDFSQQAFINKGGRLAAAFVGGNNY